LGGLAALRDLGARWLKDLDRPEHRYQLVADGRRRDFPPLSVCPQFS
jgi:hypothetical protein